MVSDENSENAKNKTEENVSSSQNISDSVINKSNVTITHHPHYSEINESQKEAEKEAKKAEREVKKAKDNEIGALLAEKVKEFNSRIDNEPKFSKMIEGKSKTICICVSGKNNFSTKLDNMRIDDFVLDEEADADLVVTANSETLLALIQRKISPVKAYMTGDLKVKASLTDMLLLKRLF
jgi:putative sterol carrier protein